MRYTTIFFDVGETLVKVPKPAHVYHQILCRHGCDLELDHVEQIVEQARKTVDELVPNWVTEDHVLDGDAALRRRTLHVDTIVAAAGVRDPEPARSDFFALYVGTEFFTLYEDVPPTLRQLQAAGYRLAIVSNWERRLETLCASHGIAEFFDFAVISELEGFVKPHVELYRRALQRAGVPPDRVLHVGDKLREDVDGAAQAGIRTVLIDRAESLETDYEPRIRSLLELPSLLDRLTRD